MEEKLEDILNNVEKKIVNWYKNCHQMVLNSSEARKLSILLGPCMAPYFVLTVKSSTDAKLFKGMAFYYKTMGLNGL